MSNMLRITNSYDGNSGESSGNSGRKVNGSQRHNVKSKASRYRTFNTMLVGTDRNEKLKNMEGYVDWYIGQNETSKNGMEHIQLMFGFKFNKTLEAVIKKLKDENIQITNDPNAMLKYCTNEEKRDKDTEILVYGDVPNFSRKCNNEMIESALACPTYEEAMKYMESNDVLYFIQNQKKLSFYFEQKYNKNDHSLYKKEDFDMPLIPIPKNIVLVFIGATGLGKTQFALAHFKYPLHIRDKEDWRRLNGITDGIVLDDLDFANWSPLTFLKLLDVENPITQNVKYGSVRIRAGLPRIICCNHEDLLWPKNIHDETKAACKRRMVIHTFHTKLFGVKRDFAREIMHSLDREWPIYGYNGPIPEDQGFEERPDREEWFAALTEGEHINNPLLIDM